MPISHSINAIVEESVFNQDQNMTIKPTNKAKIIANKEGWVKNMNKGRGSRSYRNNNPGNLDYYEEEYNGLILYTGPFSVFAFSHGTMSKETSFPVLTLYTL